MATKCRKKCPKNVQKLSRGAESTKLDNFCLFGQGFCLVTLSNARPLQPQRVPLQPQRVCLRSALLTKEVLGAGLPQDCALSVTDPSEKAISETFVRQVQVPIFAVTPKRPLQRSMRIVGFDITRFASHRIASLPATRDMGNSALRLEWAPGARHPDLEFQKNLRRISEKSRELLFLNEPLRDPSVLRTQRGLNPIVFL